MKENSERIIKIAKMFYENNLSKTEISRRENISRNHVAQILDYAKELGMVEIQIQEPDQRTEFLQMWLTNYFGLNSCNVFWCGSSEEEHEEILIEKLVRLLKSKSGENIWIGIDEKSFTHRAVEKYLSETPDSILNIVALTGTKANAQKGDFPFGHRREKIRYFSLPCPLEVESAEDKKIYYQSSIMQRIVAKWSKVNMAVVCMDDSAEFSFPYSCELECLKHMIWFLDNPQKDVGHFLGKSINIKGEFLDIKRNERILAIGSEQFNKIHTVAAVAYGREHLYSIIGMLNTGLVTDLYIDDKTAKLLISIAAISRNRRMPEKIK